MNHVNKQTVISLIFILLALAWLIYHSEKRSSKVPPPVERVWPVMGTFASVTLPATHAQQLDEICETTASLLTEINARMSVYLPNSEISQLNSTTSTVAISAITESMLQQARYYTEQTGGAFDATIMPLIQLWGFSGGKHPVERPSADMITQALSRTGITNLVFGDGSARFTAAGTELDLGGIAKGFAVDQCYEAVIGQTPVDAIFNLGGNIRVHGTATQKRPWRIGVQDPFDKHNTVGVLDLSSGMAVATSGNYERFVMIDGKRYAHIIDPRTGHPVSGMAGVTVLSQSATEADALSTALFVIGIDDAAALLKRFPESEAILIPDQTPLEIYVSSGMVSPFKPHPEYRDKVRLLPIHK